MRQFEGLNCYQNTEMLKIHPKTSVPCTIRGVKSQCYPRVVIVEGGRNFIAPRYRRHR